MSQETQDLEKKMDGVSTKDLEEDIVNPWEVASASDKGVDYDKLISKKKIHLQILFVFRIHDLK